MRRSREVTDLREWTPEELAALEISMSGLGRHVEHMRETRALLDTVSELQMTAPARLGECLDLYESHRADLCMPVLPSQRQAQIPEVA